MANNFKNPIKRGFTIVESIVAVYIFFVIIIFIFNIFPSVHKGLALSENTVFAAMLGDSVIDAFRSGTFSNITGSVGNIANISGIRDGRPFSITFTYDVLVQSISQDLKYVEVPVRWNEPSGGKQVVIDTRITN